MYSATRHLVRQSCRPMLVFRQCHQQAGGHGSDRAGNKVSQYFNKVLDNPLPLGVGALVVGVLQWRRIREREARKEAEAGAGGEAASAAPAWQVTCYRALPLRHVSRLWGWLNEVELPRLLRPAILGLYAKSFGCVLEEAECSDLEEYPSLGQFFRRRLRAGCRTVEAAAPLVSPCDGKVLHWGAVDLTAGVVEQVKGVTYSLHHFLGPGSGVAPAPGHKLYQSVLYLAPGDYHCFHAPADWTISSRRHFPGELLSVSPGVVRRVPSLFCLNERVSYLGTWAHGFFSMTAVGATNVGSVKVGLDPELDTNTRAWEADTFHQKTWDKGARVTKGEYFGEFNLGSSIVLVFEAPEDFKFNFPHEGAIVKVGSSVMVINDDNHEENTEKCIPPIDAGQKSDNAVIVS